MTSAHCVSVSLPHPTTCWAFAQSSTVSTQCQQKSTSINSVSSWLSLPGEKVPKSPCQVTRQEKWLFRCLCCRSRIRAHNKLYEAKKLWDLSQYIFLLNLFTKHQYSSSYSQCKQKLMKVLSDLSLLVDKPSFLIIAYMKQQTFSVCAYVMETLEREGQKSSGNSLSTSCGLLGWQSKRLASFGQNETFWNMKHFH